MKKKGLPVVYMHPKEKPIAWVGMFMLLKGTPRPNLAHAYVDAWSSTRRRSGSRTTTATATRTSWRDRRRATCCTALQLTNPQAVTLPNALPRPRHPAARLYAKLWEEVKAA